jgi:hypothetical protein
VKYLFDFKILSIFEKLRRILCGVCGHSRNLDYAYIYLVCGKHCGTDSHNGNQGICVGMSDHSKKGLKLYEKLEIKNSGYN